MTTQPKNIYPGRDFIDSWFNCVRLLNHVKVTLTKPFTRGMKSAKQLVPSPLSCLLLCQCSPRPRSPSSPHSLYDCFRAAAAGLTHIKEWRHIKKKKTEEIKKNDGNWFEKQWYRHRSDPISHFVLPAATSAVLVHVDKKERKKKLTSTLAVHVEVPSAISHGRP